MRAILAVSTTVPVLYRYVHMALPLASSRQRIISSAAREASHPAPDVAGKIVDGANRVLVAGTARIVCERHRKTGDQFTQCYD
jgi:hypothetical protein